MATTTNVSPLKINYLTQAQYDTALANNEINANELYFTPAANAVSYMAGSGLSLSGTTFSVKTGYTTSGNNRKVQTDDNGNLYVVQKDDNTTYAFEGGTNGFKVTPSGGTTATITVTPSIANNITGSGTSGYLAKFNGANTITNGPQLGSSTSTYLRNDGTWATPPNTTYSAGTGLSLSSTTFSVKLNSTTSLGTIGTTDKLYAVGVDANGKLCVNVPWSSGISGTVPISQGGTGKTTAREGLHALTAGLTEGTAVPTDNTVFMCGNTSEATNDWYYRKFSTVWSYIATKLNDGSFVDKNYIIKDGTIDLTQSNNNISAQNAQYLGFRDKNNNLFALYQLQAQANGNVELYMGVRNQKSDASWTGWTGITISKSKTDNTSITLGAPTTVNSTLRANNLLTLYRESTTAQNYPAGITFTNKDTTTGQSYNSVIYAYNDHAATTYGHNMVISPRGNMFIGSGESAESHYALYTSSTSENFYLTADGTVYIQANGNTIGNRAGFYVNTAQEVLPCKAETATTNTGKIGNASYLWNAIYTENLLVGKRETTTTPSSDTGINRITITPYYHTGGPWYIRSVDNSSNAHFVIRYGGTDVFSIRHNGLTTIGNLLQVVANGNTTTIGSQNTSFCHIYNSANIPFIFNKTVASTDGDLGTSGYPWKALYLGNGTESQAFGNNTNNRSKIIFGASLATSRHVYLSYVKADEILYVEPALQIYRPTTESTFNNQKAHLLVTGIICSEAGIGAEFTTSSSWVGQRRNSAFYSGVLRLPKSSGYTLITDEMYPHLSMKSYVGDWSLCTYTNNRLYLSYVLDSNFNNNTNTQTAWAYFTNEGALYLKASVHNGSDRKLKENIAPINYAQDFIMSLQPVEYIRKDNESHRLHMGFIAQDVAKIGQKLNKNLSVYAAIYDDTNHQHNYYGEDNVDDEHLRWTLDYSEIIAPLVQVVQDQQKEIDELKEQNQKLLQYLNIDENIFNKEGDEINGNDN